MASAVDRLASAPMREQFAIISLDEAFNNRGLAVARARADGHFNIWGNSFPEEDLPPLGNRFVHRSVPFVLNRLRAKDNVVCAGQSIAFPSQRVAALAIIGASERRSRGQFTLTFQGECQTVVNIGVSDWWPGARGHFGNRIFRRGSRLHYPRHSQENMRPALWWARRSFSPVVADEIHFPDNPAIHVFAMTCEIKP